MFVFIDPANENQVMAVYEGPARTATSSTVWTDQGFTRHTVKPGLVCRSRDYRASQIDAQGMVIAFEHRANAIRPTPDAPAIVKAAARARLAAKADADLSETERDILRAIGIRTK
jgi:hypothetical protein